MNNLKRLWILLGVVVVVSFAVLLYFGGEIYRQAPPIAKQVVVEGTGEVLFTEQQVKDGQNVWQSTGGQQLGSVWGHGSYVAPDWTAEWLHREAVFLLDRWAQADGAASYESLDAEKQAALKARLKRELRTNRYDAVTGVLTVSADRAESIKANSAHYAGLFGGGTEGDLPKLREAYAMMEKTVKDLTRLQPLNAFLFWASWSCMTERPGLPVTYTNNWPHEPLIDNVPSGSLMLWTGFSVIMLLVGVALLAFHYARGSDEELPEAEFMPESDPLLGQVATPSMRATLKYFWVVCALLLVQVLLGVVTAHFGVEGQHFYGLPLAEYLPYSVARTWHVQLAVLWIAVAWLATGLYIAPAVSGHEPKFQRLGVNVLFGAVVFVLLGSMAGQWMGIMQKLGLAENFWFGHQGYEYAEMGRLWQILLFTGLIIWLTLMGRAMWPALRKPSESRNLLVLFFLSSVAIAVFFAAGLMWERQTHLSMATYWRWWVVHLWVEGFFEVFATVVITFMFTRMGLLRVGVATAGVLFATTIFLAGGILGTFHHLYFAGTPTSVLALGATFSALEVVPLVLIGFEAWHNYKLSQARGWVREYKWPIWCMLSVSFWNMLGAGIFGFLINPPIALYYMQGLNTTPLHGHTALFGVYGMLGIGLMLFVTKGLAAPGQWKEGLVRFSFWAINIGLLLMALLSLLPLGLLQTVASVNHGLWYARSEEFLGTGIMDTFKWLRVVGDTIFAIGTVTLAWFVLGLKTGWSLKDRK
ncbi:MAG TPA: nitric-oxide reductase large subunit [Bacteroidia bacterium]|nr:nitric-oxide reductase large subunit [Bacteroidia bacterium]